MLWLISFMRLLSVILLDDGIDGDMVYYLFIFSLFWIRVVQIVLAYMFVFQFTSESVLLSFYCLALAGIIEILLCF